jgi:putative DNA primase/helicase
MSPFDATNAEASSGTSPVVAEALEIARLAALSPLEYDRERVSAAERLGVRVSTLDDMVKAARPKPEGGTGRRIGLREPTPWPEPAPLGPLLGDLAAAFARHVFLPPGAATALSLWVAHTYTFQNFEHSPRLAIRSPTKRCGKSTLLEVIEATAHRPMQSGSISAAGAFRIVESMGPLTLLLDETDTFLRDNEELRGVLNNGFNRSGFVVRVVEQNGEHVPVHFATYAPVAFAGIGDLPDTLEDRSVPVVLQRKGVADAVTRLRAPGAREHLAELAARCARWAQDEGQRLGRDPAMPEALNDREQDICVPLLAIADQAGGAWPQRAREALLTLFGRRAAEGAGIETGVMLLTDIKTLFNDIGAEQMPSAELAEKLGRMEERPWPEWRHNRPMTAPQLARQLAPFGVRPGTIRRGNETPKGYRREQFQEAWARYLPEAEGGK